MIIYPNSYPHYATPGKDVFAQQQVMARYGGCGLIPSGVYHQELPTTIVDRSVNAPVVLYLTKPLN